MRKFLPLILLLALTGCADPALLGGAAVVSYSVIGKSPTDYALSRGMHMDCDIRNPKRYNGEYCVPENNQAMLTDPPIYCYRTLATPDCSSQIDPHNNGNQPIVSARQGGMAQDVSYVGRGAPEGDMPISLTPAPNAATPPAHAIAPLSESDSSLRENDIK